MNQNKHSELRYPKLIVEALLKSLFCGLIVSFSAVFAAALIFWTVGMINRPLGIGLLCGAFVLLTALSGAIFYFLKFRPTTGSNAKRIDSLGLEERTITMIEYENDDSLIASFQRNDAKKALSSFDKKLIKFQFSNNMIISNVVSAVLSISMVMVWAFAPSLGQIIERNEPPLYIPITYEAEEGGYIDGETEQLVLLGESAETVVAVPEEGYSFEGWDDGFKKPTRSDENIDHPLVLIAIFVPIDEESEDDDMDGEHGENGDAPGEEEGENGQSSNKGDNPGDQPSDSGGDASTRDQNFIIDGTDKNDYKLHLPDAKDKIMELLKKNIDELTEEERAIIEAYINIL